MYGFKECSSCGALYNKDHCCSVDTFVRDPNETPDSSKQSLPNCPNCGDPVDGLVCRPCAFVRKCLNEVCFTSCDENESFKNLLNPPQQTQTHSSESSNDNTNFVDTPQEPIVENQDPGENFAQNSSQSPPQITQNCCYGCGDSLDGFFCQRCTCESCGNGAHYGYNCPPQVPIISNPEPCYNQNFDEFPQTSPSTDTRPPMLVESDYDSWKIRIHRVRPGVNCPRMKNLIQNTNCKRAGEIWDNVEMLMQGSGRTLQQRKEDLFDEFERFRAIGNEPIHDYFEKSSRDVGNAGSKGNQSYGNVTTATGKKVICYNYRGEGHVVRQCKEPKRAKDSQYFKDKMLLMEAKEKGVTLDAEAEAFLANVECTAPYDQPLAMATTNIFKVNHEDCYEVRDVAERPNAAAAFMANLSSISGQCLAKCKLEIVRLDTQQVKLDLERQVRQEQNLVTQRNERNAELEQEKVMLKIHLKSKDVSIEFLKSENQKVLTDKKKLEDKYLDEIVCLKSANKVATDLLQKFQMPTHTIPMLSKKPKNASQDLHKDILGRSNPRYGKKAPVINASNMWDTDETLASAEVSMAKMKGKPGHVRPASGFYEKLNAMMFVPQKELSQTRLECDREHNKVLELEAKISK
ncbi:hypothetical protein Tco_0013638 [Tanacetum coccineum]